jgi:hypothetical protein
LGRKAVDFITREGGRVKWGESRNEKIVMVNLIVWKEKKRK